MKRTSKFFVIALIAAGFAVGYATGRFTGRHSAAEKVAQTYIDIPEPLKDQIRSMSKEDIDRMMKTIREYSQNAVLELSLKDLFESMTIMRIEAIAKESGEAGVAEFTDRAKERFVTGYRDGSSRYGDWQKVADTLVKKIEAEKN
jgi:hypothetical protein